jgi:hypothetical protein
VGIRLVTPAKVLNHAIEKFAQLTGEVWKGFNRNGLLYGPSGDDSPPCKDDQIVLVKIDGTGKYIVLGVLDVSQSAKPGEKILYARDDDAKIVSKISMLNDGSIAVEADGDTSWKTKGAHSLEAEGDISVNGKKNVSSEAAEKNTIKGADVEVSGNTKITGGSLECNGTASPTGTGCWCAKPFCTWDGSPHTGNKAAGT